MEPWLSVVAVSRNDDHGGDPLRRTMLFIESLAWQAEHFKLPVELILVDWNPPAGKPGLGTVLSYPVGEYFTARIITVPTEVHDGFRHGDRLPLFQMIGKNVGIRRAKGEFILATNIDILLDDRLFEAIARKDLRTDCFYRADRYDVANTIPDADHAAQQAFCRTLSNHVRRNYRLRPENYAQFQDASPWSSDTLLHNSSTFPEFEFLDGDFPCACLKSGADPLMTSTNACGDFTLMSKQAWETIGGYAEYEAYSMHIDSIGLYCAHLAGLAEYAWLPPLVCYHIEHAPGSGWTPEASKTLEDRIHKARVPFLEWKGVAYWLVPRLREPDGWQMNEARWGLSELSLTEECVTMAGREETKSELARTHPLVPLAALKQKYDPASMFQDMLVWQSQEAEYVRFRRLTSHRYWQMIEKLITLTRRLRNIKRGIANTFSR